MIANLTVIYIHIKTLTGLLQNTIMVAASSLCGFCGDSYHGIPVHELNIEVTIDCLFILYC